MLELIEFESRLLALIVRKEYSIDEGIKFFTPSDFSQQLGYMKRAKGYSIEPHVHRPVERSVEFTKEVLLIKRGVVRVDFYSEQMSYLKSSVLREGDVILLAFGGHGFKVLEDCEMIEVKQGPYAGERDKSRFEAVADEEIRLN